MVEMGIACEQSRTTRTKRLRLWWIVCHGQYKVLVGGIQFYHGPLSMVADMLDVCGRNWGLGWVWGVL